MHLHGTLNYSVSKGIRVLSGRSAAILPGVRRMPAPIVPPTTIEIPKATPNIFLSLEGSCVGDLIKLICLL